MPRPRFQNADPEKREAILQAAAREIAQNGYEGASINRILASAGMSKGAFYYYFDDKADLAAEVMHWAYADVLGVFDRMEPTDDPERFWDNMQAYSREGLAMFERAPYSLELVTRVGLAATRHPELMQRVMGTFSKALEVFTKLLADGQRLGALRTDLRPETLAALLQAVKEAGMRALLPEGRPPTPEEFEHISDLLMDMYRRICAPSREESP